MQMGPEEVPVVEELLDPQPTVQTPILDTMGICNSSHHNMLDSSAATRQYIPHHYDEAASLTRTVMAGHAGTCVWTTIGRLAEAASVKCLPGT